MSPQEYKPRVGKRMTSIKLPSIIATNQSPLSSNGLSWRRRRRRTVGDRLAHFLYLVKHRKRDALFYAVGPAGIVKVLYMTSKLLYTYAAILLPMILRKYNGSRFKWIVLLGHLSLETYLLTQIFFNYYFCITTKHSGPHQDQVVQEIAMLTEFNYPYTQASLAAHQKHVETRLASVDIDSKGKKTPSWLLLDPFEWGYCENTQQPRPPRSHYSHVIRTLVLNFDHYCPWIWNAVGYFNYRYFMTFLLSVFAMMVYKASIIMEPFLYLSTDKYRTQRTLERKAMSDGIAFQREAPMIPLQSEKTLLRQSMILSLVLCSAMLFLGGFHVYLTLTAQTTVEYHAQRACCGSKRRKSWQNTRPYSFSRLIDNWKRVFGRNWIWSLLIPNTKPPEYLPFPIPGHNGLRTNQVDSYVQSFQVETAWRSSGSWKC